MNFNNSKYDDIRNKIFIAKGIEQTWHRRVFHHIHSGVRVKIQRKYSSFIKPVQQNIHHELKNQNGQKLLVSTNNSSQTLPIVKDSFLRKNHLLEIKQKDKNMNSIGIQTIMREQIDRQISCNLIKAPPILIRKSRSSTSISNENSTNTDSTPTEISTVSSSTTADSNKSRNNNAIEINIERKNNHIMKEFQMEKAVTHLSVIIYYENSSHCLK